MDFGKNFIRARTKRGLEQYEAAEALGVSASFLSNIERDKKKPSLNLIENAAKLYGVKMAYFFEPYNEIDINALYTDKNKAFIEDLSSLSDEEIKDKYNITLDGKELTKEEIRGFIAFIRSMRSI